MIYHKFRFVWIIFIKSNPIANTTKRLLDVLWNYFKTLKKNVYMKPGPLESIVDTCFSLFLQPAGLILIQRPWES